MWETHNGMYAPKLKAHPKRERMILLEWKTLRGFAEKPLSSTRNRWVETRG